MQAPSSGSGGGAAVGPACWAAVWARADAGETPHRPASTWGALGWRGRVGQGSAKCRLGPPAAWRACERPISGGAWIAGPRKPGWLQMPVSALARCCHAAGTGQPCQATPCAPGAASHRTHHQPAPRRPPPAPQPSSSWGEPFGPRQRASSSHGGHLEWRSGGRGGPAGRQPKGSSPGALALDHLRSDAPPRLPSRPAGGAHLRSNAPAGRPVSLSTRCAAARPQPFASLPTPAPLARPCLRRSRRCSAT